VSVATRGPRRAEQVPSAFSRWMRVVARKRGPSGDAPRTRSLEELPGSRRAEGWGRSPGRASAFGYAVPGKLRASANGPAANGSRSRGEGRTRPHSVASARVATRPLRPKLAPARSGRTPESGQCAPTARAPDARLRGHIPASEAPVLRSGAPRPQAHAMARRDAPISQGTGTFGGARCAYLSCAGFLSISAPFRR
jgi:hypothetical protein